MSAVEVARLVEDLRREAPQGVDIEGRVVPAPADYDGSFSIEAQGVWGARGISVRSATAAGAVELFMGALREARETA